MFIMGCPGGKFNMAAVSAKRAMVQGWWSPGGLFFFKHAPLCYTCRGFVKSNYSVVIPV